MATAEVGQAVAHHPFEWAFFAGAGGLLLLFAWAGSRSVGECATTGSYHTLRFLTAGGLAFCTAGLLAIGVKYSWWPKAVEMVGATAMLALAGQGAPEGGLWIGPDRCEVGGCYYGTSGGTLGQYLRGMQRANRSTIHVEEACKRFMAHTLPEGSWEFETAAPDVFSACVETAFLRAGAGPVEVKLLVEGENVYRVACHGAGGGR